MSGGIGAAPHLLMQLEAKVMPKEERTEGGEDALGHACSVPAANCTQRGVQECKTTPPAGLR